MCLPKKLIRLSSTLCRCPLFSATLDPGSHTLTHIKTITMTDKPYLEQPELHVKAPYRAAQLTYPGNAKQALKDAMEDPTKTLFGIGHGIPSVFVTKVCRPRGRDFANLMLTRHCQLLASTKPDFIWIDVEHAMYNRLELHE